MLEKTVEGKIRTVYFVSVATLMYYLLQEVELGELGRTLTYLDSVQAERGAAPIPLPLP